MDAIRIIRLADSQRQRWRNDGGWTREIARSGDETDWDWRLSLAEVETDGPFSTFAGIEREIVLLSGAGMAFDFADGEQVELTPQTPQLRFAGERELRSRLIDGVTTDFNLMWRRDCLEADLWLRPLVGSSTLFVEPGETWALHVSVGRVHLQDANAELGQGDSVILYGGARRRSQCIDGTGSAIFMRLKRRTD